MSSILALTLRGTGEKPAKTVNPHAVNTQDLQRILSTSLASVHQPGIFVVAFKVQIYFWSPTAAFYWSVRIGPKADPRAEDSSSPPVLCLCTTARYYNPRFPPMWSFEAKRCDQSAHLCFMSQPMCAQTLRLSNFECLSSRKRFISQLRNLT